MGQRDVDVFKAQLLEFMLHLHQGIVQSKGFIVASSVFRMEPFTNHASWQSIHARPPRP